MSQRTPVAIFIYNRPEHTERLIHSVLKCDRRDECEFVFFSDGAKNDTHAAGVAATRAVVRDHLGALRGELVERTANLGLARSIESGVSALCASHGRVIVVEDDLVLNPNFLGYMIDGLDRYQDESSVMQVAGCTLSPAGNPVFDAFFIPVTTTWGWATWQRAWKHFSWQAADFDALRRDADFLGRFNLGGACDFTQMLDDRLAGRNDSWGILWWYAVARCRGLVLYPARSLVWNGGFDGSGVHCGESTLFDAQDLESWMSYSPERPFRWPGKVEADAAMLAQLEDFFSALTTRASAGNATSSGRRSWRERVSRLLRGLTHVRP